MTDLTGEGETAPTPPPRKEKPRRTYRRDWSLYNEAKKKEARDLRELLRKACRALPKELYFQQRMGRHRIDLQEAAFACVLKVYHLFSGRRSTFFFEEAVRDRYLSRNIHWNSVGNYLRDSRMTDVFQYLIATTALPLIPNEHDGGAAFDATYVPGGLLIPEGVKLYGGYKDFHMPVKLNIASGIRTHVVMACIIEGPTDHEHQFLPGLLVTAMENGYKIAKVYADKAYLSAEHYELFKKLGIQGYIPFRISDRGKKGGEKGEFYRMFHYVMATQATQKAFGAEAALRIMSKRGFRCSNDSRDALCLIGIIFQW
jgi:hypothetical protein